MTVCDQCDGFGWHPLDADGAPLRWDGRDLTPVLDPTRRWRRCSCRADDGTVGHLQACLAAWLLARIDREIDDRRSTGGWQVGRLANGSVVWRWRDLACFPDLRQPGHWILASDMGVMVGLAADDLLRHLERAGAPAPPQGV